MTDFTVCHEQNHKITELSNVFLYLIRDRSMCDTECARNLFFEYVSRVREHMEKVDAQICGHLIQSQDRTMTNTANRFLSGSQEIKRIFAAYVKDWGDERRRELKIADHEAFVGDTNEVFGLIMDRIQRETEHLYPLVRKLEQTRPAAVA
ncbi:MAG: hypothetical protein JZU52_06755 [Lamprocystis purpurea]|jgi:hypothetical protein|uniref:hypothetical protein n=1 Tax=Lamprocystis purpurea TaxID=61598 RepID=UPI00037703E6|nr:hypothetical protein [Lamprocystis purpurea]MBV5273340.1 hypothetical protein [Lamprocystis purpurea]